VSLSKSVQNKDKDYQREIFFIVANSLTCLFLLCVLINKFIIEFSSKLISPIFIKIFAAIISITKKIATKSPYYLHNDSDYLTFIL
jgi:hypothetical protein